MRNLKEAPALSRGGRWNLEKINSGETFKCISGNATYAKHDSGAIVRVDKERRSPKERKRARREARASQATPESAAVS